MGFPGGSVVKKKQTCLTVQEIWFNPWVGKIPWRKKMATHSRILAWEILWTEKLGRLQFMGSQRAKTQLRDRVCTQASMLSV